jgi:hypothetical protein
MAPPAPLISCLVVVALLSLGYLWLDCRCKALGRDIKSLEATQRDAGIRYEYEWCRWTEMKSPRNLERTLTAHGVGMALPRPQQVVHFSAGPLSEAEWTASAEALAYARIDGIRRNE